MTSIARQSVLPGQTPMRRSARVKTTPEDIVVDERIGMATLSVKLTVSLRITFNHLRRRAHRGQSFQRTGARGGTTGASE